MKAEKQCDDSFNQLMSDATQDYTQAGLGTEDINNWRKQYTDSKQQARQQALAELGAALKKG
jgi:hypothetical protein